MLRKGFTLGDIGSDLEAVVLSSWLGAWLSEGIFGTALANESLRGVCRNH